MNPSSRQILLNAFYIIGQGKPYTFKTDSPEALQRALHKTLRRYKWKGYRVSKDGKAIVINRKVVK